jgi:hypothetical protein
MNKEPLKEMGVVEDVVPANPPAPGETSACITSKPSLFGCVCHTPSFVQRMRMHQR